MSEMKEIQIQAQAVTEPTEVHAAVSRAADFIERMWSFSERICKAKFVPEAARGDAASTFFLVATAQDLGLKWTHGLRSMYMTPDGKIGLQGDVMLALLYSHGFEVQFPEKSPTAATCVIKRPGAANPFVWRFTMEDAARIPRYDRDRKCWSNLATKHNYRAYPTNMLMWRALANCARFAAADILGGIYLPDELEEVTENASAPADVAEAVSATPASAVGIKPKPGIAPPSDSVSAPQASAAGPGAEMDLELELDATNPEAAPESATAEAETEAEDEDEGDAYQSPEERDLTRKFKQMAARVCPTDQTEGSRTLLKYFRGFYALKGRLPEGVLNYKDAINKLWDAIDSSLADLKADPVGLGRTLRASADSGTDVAEQLMEKLGWPEDCREMARHIMRQCRQSPSDFVTWVNAEVIPGAPLVKLSIDDLRQFLKLYLLCIEDAWDVLEFRVRSGKTMAEAVKLMEQLVELPASQWDPKAAMMAVEKLREHVG
jgi:hypothetical protein